MTREAARSGSRGGISWRMAAVMKTVRQEGAGGFAIRLVRALPIQKSQLPKPTSTALQQESPIEYLS